jgi:hypothetical protein
MLRAGSAPTANKDALPGFLCSHRPVGGPRKPFGQNEQNLPNLDSAYFVNSVEKSSARSAVATANVFEVGISALSVRRFSARTNKSALPARQLPDN